MSTNQTPDGWLMKIRSRLGGGNKSRDQREGQKSYDPAVMEPVLHKSICNGETTAGFKDRATGKYTDVALIRSEADLKRFMDEYGIKERPRTEY